MNKEELRKRGSSIWIKLHDRDFLVPHTSAIDCDSREKACVKFKNKCEGRREDELVRGHGRVGAHSESSLVSDHFSFSTSSDQMSTDQTNLRPSNTDESAVAATGVT